MDTNIIGVDFDAVLNLDLYGDDGVRVTSPPVPGALKFIEDLILDGFEPVVFSHRAKDQEGRNAIKEWLEKHEFPPLKVTDRKPPALVYIDDRNYRFEGDFADAARFIRSDDAVPWTERKELRRANG